MTIAIGCDHAGIELKKEILSLLQELHLECIDYGTDGPQSVDYPDFGEKVSEAVSAGKIEKGILICGTGIGMSIVANKFPGVRASLCNELFTAKMSRLHNDANILVLGGRIVGKDLAKEIVKTWVSTPFEGARHRRRLDKISHIEERLQKHGICKS
ncbi:MAG TPA: ribose 5-phosphate isomerase B [Thermodesulfovibrionales bacterium]|jgi:ribose 5-phosphate isomerase B|nr:ribose 5-phosphate isomerase B [Thermodesulfovibrionales bacterium]